MSALILKIIACITMLSDHYGYAFGVTFPYRFLGRMAFPIYAFLLTEGYLHTRNIKKYISRLFLFALISEIPFNLFTVGKPIFIGSSLNIYFTLTLALIALYMLDFFNNMQRFLITKIITSFFIMLPFCLVAEVLNTDYGFYGILTVVGYRYLKNASKKHLSLISGHLVIIFLYVFFFHRDSWGYTQFCAIIALIPILSYNGKKGFSPENPSLTKFIQYGFYAFYPLHLFILYLIH